MNCHGGETQKHRQACSQDFLTEGGGGGGGGGGLR